MEKCIHGRFWDDLWNNMDYWIRTGDDKKTALSKAYWWDFIEVWNIDKSWNDDKKNFCRLFVLLFPNCKCPED